ncbi:MAG: hypothetical protein IT462_15300 [Planctomycetes bacterium]|nr:hypothetical protein [Planctomycetota bacterium]
MIKLSAAYGAKIPGPKEFSSESYHASAEIELAGTADGEGLKAALSLLWEDLKSAVDGQIAGKAVTARPAVVSAAPAGSNGHSSHTHAPVAHTNPAYNAQPAATPVNRIAGDRGGDPPASKKQIGFLLSLCRRHKNFSAEQCRTWLQAEHGLKLNQLTKSEAGQVIDQLQGK